jgi:predicted transcriptional regulator
MFFIPSEKVTENRSCPEAVIEKFFAVFDNGKRVALMRALLSGDNRTSAALREETGLTEGQFYHHMRDLAAAECLIKGGQDQYRLSDTGKILLLIAEAVASELAATTPLRPEET